MKIRVRGLIFDIASIQVHGLGTTIYIQYIDPQAGLLIAVLTSEEFRSVLVLDTVP